MRLKKFIFSTFFTTLKNDSELVSVSVSIPASATLTPGASTSYTSDATVGSAGSPMLITLKEPFNNDYIVYRSPIQYVYITGGNQLTGFVSIFRPTPTTARIRIDLYNPSPVNVTTEGVTRTFTAYIRTYLPPFS